MTKQISAKEPRDSREKRPRKLEKREQRLRERLQETLSAQERALERVHKAEARLEKRQARIQRLEERLALLRGRPQHDQAKIEASTDTTDSQPLVVAEAAGEQGEEYSAVSTVVTLTVEGPEPQDQAEPDALGIAHEARAAAFAAEEAARIAVERVQSATNQVEQAGSARHLLSEMEQLRSEADTAQSHATEAKQAAVSAEEEAGIESPAQETGGSEPFDVLVEDEWTFIDDDSEDERSVMARGLRGAYLSSNQELEEPIATVASHHEDEVVEAVAAMIVADAAAAAAAEAEALAEASRAYTRETALEVWSAEQEVTRIRAALQTGTLGGESATTALEAAEKAVAYAQAQFMEAQAREEQAVKAAREAEEQARLAEGLAFASNEYVPLQSDAPIE